MGTANLCLPGCVCDIINKASVCVAQVSITSSDNFFSALYNACWKARHNNGQNMCHCTNVLHSRKHLIIADLCAATK